MINACAAIRIHQSRVAIHRLTLTQPRTAIPNSQPETTRTSPSEFKGSNSKCPPREFKLSTFDNKVSTPRLASHRLRFRLSPPLYIGIFTGRFFSIYIYLCLFYLFRSFELIQSKLTSSFSNSFPSSVSEFVIDTLSFELISITFSNPSTLFLRIWISILS